MLMRRVKWMKLRYCSEGSKLDMTAYTAAGGVRGQAQNTNLACCSYASPQRPDVTIIAMTA